MDLIESVLNLMDAERELKEESKATRLNKVQMGGEAPVAEYQLCKGEELSSNPSPTRTKQKSNQTNPLMYPKSTWLLGETHFLSIFLMLNMPTHKPLPTT